VGLQREFAGEGTTKKTPSELVAVIGRHGRQSIGQRGAVETKGK
jgi:hypothetical protein